MSKFKSFRLYDYNVYDGINKHTLASDKLLNNAFNPYKDNKKFIIQAFGINDSNKTASILIEDFYPFFYIMVDDTWNEQRKNLFMADLKKKVGNYYEESILSLKLVKRQKLYGFDNKKLHTFVKISFTNSAAYNKAKKLFYTDTTNKYTGFERTLNDTGYIYSDDQGTTNCYLYEADIPPLLKFFHEKQISPSGWIKMPSNKVKKVNNKTTHCAYEYCISYDDIYSYKEKESLVKYNICSFDIEASSSHGDFPLPIKNYKKLATNILENYVSATSEFRENYDISMLKQEILTAFELTQEKLSYIAKVYPKTKSLDSLNVENLMENLLNYIPANFNKKENTLEMSDSDSESEVELESDDEKTDNDISVNKKKKKVKVKAYNKKDATLIELLKDESCEYNTKLLELTEAFKNTGFPELEGDIITFIGLSFINYTESKPYKRIIIVKGGCKIPDKYLQWIKDNNVVVLERNSEKDVLLTFTKLIISENPHIITGYNITGFDFEFMYKRSKELNCTKEFIKLSRNKDELCLTKDWKTGIEDIETNKIVLASGEYNLKFIKMAGRIIIDMCIIFRKEFTLSSNKLDFTSSYFISDSVTKIEVNTENNTSKIYSKNLTGISVGSFIKFDEVGFSSNLYKQGKKFEITEINKDKDQEEGGSWFIIDSVEDLDLSNYKYNWGLAKDDVTPQEIFALANGTDYDRWIVGKYCLADCDNVIWLLLKVDVITDKVEMSNLCDVPLSFLLLRGQGIKLHSYISKKCGEKNTLMPVIKKQSFSGGYEGAHVFTPKTGIYLEDPVACVDYSSLYPSSIISENLSHDSKVWTKEYDLNNVLINETGEKCENGEKDENTTYKYDNLYDLGYKYVDVKYDTYHYKRLTPKAAEKKVIMGYKICRFAQFPDGKAIMPAILEDLLAARKATRKLITLENDEFMKNVLDKRQLSIKVTANSLYGQMGATTSAFYEPDIAASTTAIGRKLLFYGRSIIEECYNEVTVQVHDGKMVKARAECVYGDSVTNQTPVYIRIDQNMIEILTVEGLAKKYGYSDLWESCKEDGKEEKLYMNFKDNILIETWSSKGWTKLERIIKHKLHESKNIVRILTHTGIVDVTDDHSLLKKDESIISSKDVTIGTELLHKTLNLNEYISNNINNNNISLLKARISGFFFGSGGYITGKNSWTINNQNLTLLNYYKELCINVYPEFEWKIYDTLESSGVYKLIPNSKKLKVFIENYRSNHYYNNNKIIPISILNSSIEIRQAFWDGLYDADGDKDKNGIIRIDQKSQLSSSYICLLANSIGFKTSINIRKDKPDIYRITCTKNSQRKNCDAIKKIEVITDIIKNNDNYYEDNNCLYVYDLTTTNHHFAAGVGNMIVHNTDSVFFTFNLRDAETNEKILNKQSLIYTIELAKQAGLLASKFLKKPHDLEYEKTFYPWVLLSKKRYVGILYEHNPDKGKMKYMGIVLKRRDNAPLVKDIYGGIVNIIMQEKSMVKSINFLNDSIEKLIAGKYPIEKLLVTKSLKGYYKNPKQIAHKVLAERIGSRDSGNKPASGDRMYYAYIKNTNKKALQGEKIETPDFIKQNGLELDYSHYISNQIMKPLLQLFALNLENLNEFKKTRGPTLQSWKMELEKLRVKWSEPEKYEKKLEELKCKTVKVLLFDKYLKECK